MPHALVTGGMRVYLRRQFFRRIKTGMPSNAFPCANNSLPPRLPDVLQGKLRAPSRGKTLSFRQNDR